MVGLVLQLAIAIFAENVSPVSIRDEGLKCYSQHRQMLIKRTIQTFLGTDSAFGIFSKSCKVLLISPRAAVTNAEVLVPKIAPSLELACLICS